MEILRATPPGDLCKKGTEKQINDLKKDLGAGEDTLMVLPTGLTGFWKGAVEGEKKANPNNGIYFQKSVVMPEERKVLKVMPTEAVSRAALLSSYGKDRQSIEGELISCVYDNTLTFVQKQYLDIGSFCHELPIADDDDVAERTLDDLRQDVNFDSKNAQISQPLAPVGQFIEQLMATDDPIASGSFGAIFDAGNIGGVKMVLKRVPWKEIILEEIKALKKFGNSGYGSGFRGCFFVPNRHLFIFMDKLGVALDDADFLDKFQRREQKKQVEFFLEMTKAVEAFHNAGWVHEDIKPVNFLLDSQDLPKLIDYGVSVREGEFNPPYVQNSFGVFPKAYTVATHYDDLHATVLTMLYTLTNEDSFMEAEEQLRALQNKFVQVKDPQLLKGVEDEFWQFVAGNMPQVFGPIDRSQKDPSKMTVATLIGHCLKPGQRTVGAAHLRQALERHLSAINSGKKFVM